MKIKLIGIGCSPRERSNSKALLQHAMGKAKNTHGGDLEYTIIDLKDFNIESCRSCDVCGKSKEDGRFLDCILKDKDDVNKIFDMMREADGFAVATPVYFGMPTDLFSKFIMRTRVLRHQDFALANKVVGIIATAARRSGGSETTIITCWLPFMRNGCLIVGNGDKTSQYGTVAWAGARGHVMSDEWGLEQAEQTIERIFEIAKLIKAGTAASKHVNEMKFCYKSGTRY